VYSEVLTGVGFIYSGVGHLKSSQDAGT